MSSIRRPSSPPSGAGIPSFYSLARICVLTAVSIVVAVGSAAALQLSAEPSQAESPESQQGDVQRIVRQGADVPLFYCVYRFLDRDTPSWAVSEKVERELALESGELQTLEFARRDLRESLSRDQEVFQQEFEVLNDVHGSYVGEMTSLQEQALYAAQKRLFRRKTRSVRDADLWLRGNLDEDSAQRLERFVAPPRCADSAITVVSEGEPALDAEMEAALSQFESEVQR